MRILPLSATFAFVLGSCSPAPEPVSYDDIGYKKGIYIFEEAPFTGIAFTTFPEGGRHQEFGFKDGLHHGVTREWDESGTLIVETHFEAGKRHGKNTYWHPDGSLAKEQIYSHGKSISENKFPAASH